MTFIPRKYRDQDVRRLPLAANGVAVKYYHGKMSSGYAVDGDAGDNEAEFIFLETVTDATGSNGGTYVDVLMINGEQVYDATCSATPVQATHVGNDYDFAETGVDLSATTDKVFHIDEIVDAANSVVRGRFNKPALA